MRIFITCFQNKRFKDSQVHINLLMTDTFIQGDDDDIRKRMLDLEQELVEFQQSSKELEEALEDELNELDNRNQLLVSQINAKDDRLQQLTAQLGEANTEIFRISEVLATDKAKLESEIISLKQKLVAVEILNDDIGMNDRILENNLKLAEQFNNELLEKLALVESDLETERQMNAQQRLRISNLEALDIFKPTQKARHLQQFKSKARRRSVAKSTMSLADTTADGTILDLNEFLASAPPEPTQPVCNIPRADSRGRIHEQYLRSEEIVQKVGQMNHYLGLKANSTIHVSGQEAQTPRQDQPVYGHLIQSPSFANLSKYKEELPLPTPTTRGTPHEPPSRENSQRQRSKKSRIKTLMTFFA